MLKIYLAEKVKEIKNFEDTKKYEIFQSVYTQITIARVRGELFIEQVK